jgi:16S rRNA (cytosine967-C5)-methyltransferase
MNERAVVLDILLELERGNGYVDQLVRDTLDKYDYLEGRDKAFIKRLAEGTVERRITIDYVTDSFSKCSTSKMKPVIRQIIRMGVYQILFMDSVPDSAACNEAVRLAEKRRFGSLKGFVNGVLRNVARNKDMIKYPDSTDDREYALSVRESVPQETVHMLSGWYGEKKAEAVIRDFNRVHPVTIRICDMKAFSEMKDMPGWDKVRLEQHPYLDYAMTVSGADGIDSLPGFAEGIFTVQDVSSMLVTEAAGICAGQFIMDVCAAPGGKACHSAECLAAADASAGGGTQAGHLTACDVSGERAVKITENMHRLRISNMDVKVCDATVFDPGYEGKADIVFADVPCSGLGVAGRKLDIKYHVTAAGIEELAHIQWDIVSNVSRYLKPGGILIYSTCTLTEDENSRMVQKIVSELPFTAESLEKYMPAALMDELDDGEKKNVKNGCLQLLPGIQKTDGFFISRLRKKS